MSVEFERVVPILRIFDIAKAKEFYVGYLGCTVDWEHRFADGMPLYMQVSRGNLVLHLSEHHGDGTPGTVVYVETLGVRELHAGLAPRTTGSCGPGSPRTRSARASTCSTRSATPSASTSGPRLTHVLTYALSGGLSSGVSGGPSNRSMRANSSTGRRESFVITLRGLPIATTAAIACVSGMSKIGRSSSS